MLAAVQAITDATIRPQGDPILPHSFPKTSQDAMDNYTYATMFAQIKSANPGAMYA